MQTKTQKNDFTFIMDPASITLRLDMNDNDKNKLVLNSEHFDAEVDWANQRMKINERIDKQAAVRRPAWRWATALATATAIGLLAWFGIHQITERQHEADILAQLEQDIDEIVDGRVPESLMVLNGWTDPSPSSNTIPASLDVLNNSETEDEEKEAL